MWETLELNEEIVECERIEGEYIGFRLKTKSYIINVLIDDYRSCCENYGCIIVKPDEEINLLKEYDTGDTLVGLYVKLVYLEEIDINYSTVIKVVLENDNEKYSIIVFNEHDGYYPHTYKISWESSEGVVFQDSDRL